MIMKRIVFKNLFLPMGGQGCSGTDWYLDITLEVWCRIWRGLLLLKCLLSKSEVYSLHL